MMPPRRSDGVVEYVMFALFPAFGYVETQGLRFIRRVNVLQHESEAEAASRSSGNEDGAFPFQLLEVEVGPEIDRKFRADGLEAFRVSNLDVITLSCQFGAIADLAMTRPARRFHVAVIQDRALGIGDIAASFIEGKIDDLVYARVVVPAGIVIHQLAVRF